MRVDARAFYPPAVVEIQLTGWRHWVVRAWKLANLVLGVLVIARASGTHFDRPAVLAVGFLYAVLGGFALWVIGRRSRQGRRDLELRGTSASSSGLDP